MQVATSGAYWKSQNNRKRKQPDSVVDKLTLDNHAVTKKLTSLQKQIKSLKQQAPNRVHDITNSATADTVGTFILLNAMGQGDNYNNREGSEVISKYLDIKIQLTNADASNILRVIIFVDKQPNGAACSSTDLLEQPANPILTHMNFNNKQRFHILRDTQIVTDTDDPYTFMKMFIKYRTKSRYSGTGSAISNITTNAIYAFVVSDSNAATHPSYVLTSRLGFYA